jgi:hypothetical protein
LFGIPRIISSLISFIGNLLGDVNSIKPLHFKFAWNCIRIVT